MAGAIAIILNGISRKKKHFYQSILPALSSKFSCEVFETQRSGHAITLALQAADKGFELILAAGGDGTLNQVLNGVMTSTKKPQPVLGLIPMGTGNDFGRMCGISSNPKFLVDLIGRNSHMPVDVGRVVCKTDQGGVTTRFFINACSIGMGPAVVKSLEKSNRSWGPMLTYWKAITTTFFTYNPQPVACKTPGWSWSGKIRVLVIANGQSFGNSLFIAPDARPDDGLLNTFIAGEIPLLKFLRYQQSLKTKNKIKDPLIEYNAASVITLTAPEKCSIETEGELAGCLPASIDVIPSGIRILR